MQIKNINNKNKKINVIRYKFKCMNKLKMGIFNPEIKFKSQVQRNPTITFFLCGTSVKVDPETILIIVLLNLR